MCPRGSSSWWCHQRRSRRVGVSAYVDVGAGIDDVAFDEVDEGLQDIVLDLLGLPRSVLVQQDVDQQSHAKLQNYGLITSHLCIRILTIVSIIPFFLRSSWDSFFIDHWKLKISLFLPSKLLFLQQLYGGFVQLFANYVGSAVVVLGQGTDDPTVSRTRF